MSSLSFNLLIKEEQLEQLIKQFNELSNENEFNNWPKLNKK